MKKILTCKVCGAVLVLDKEHHRVAREDKEVGLPTSFKSTMEPKLYDAFDCSICGSQTIVGERKREVYEAHFEESDEDMVEESEPQDEQISSSEDDYTQEDLEQALYESEEEEPVLSYNEEQAAKEDDTKDILKKIEEAGE